LGKTNERNSIIRRGVDVQKYAVLSEKEISRNGFSEDERVVHVVVVFRKSSGSIHG
jgi:predicted HTH domain antitoxin